MTIKGKQHVLQQNKSLKMQDNFIFLDTESKKEIVSDKLQVLTFKLGCSVFWKKSLEHEEEHTFYSISNFWDLTENFISYCQEQDNSKTFIMFAHNMEFDFRQLDGYRELFSRGWTLVSHYIKQSVFIFIFEKEGIILNIWSTTNYVQKPLKKIGKIVNLPKMDVDFDEDSDEYLAVYCMRDTRIIYLFIKQLIDFLESNDLSRLKPTAGSLSLNIFRHSFYHDYGGLARLKKYGKPINKPIYIHNWVKCIELERESYKGGITDCFQVGFRKNVYKLDINSMYPKSMRDCYLPYKLIAWKHEGANSQQTLMKLYRKTKPFYGVIAKVIISLPKQYAYILHDFGLGKSTFCYGKELEVVLCTPELEFVEKYGKILQIKQIAIYRTKRIFRKFVKFFYSLRQYYKKIHNEVYVEFCKLILNTLYGKFGQKETLSKMLTKEDKHILRYSELIKLMIEKRKEQLELSDEQLKETILYLGTIEHVCELYLISKKLYVIEKTQRNSENSFVAISSFITSYSRMLLIKYILIARRKNVYYTDTDSLFVNQEGYYNLQEYIDEYQLGMLKNEHPENKTYDCTFYAPKFYDYDDKRKIKGVRQKDAILLEENSIKVVYQIQQWERAKSALKNNNYEEQQIFTVKKTVRKLYDKGRISFGKVIPYSKDEIELIKNKKMNIV